MSARLTSLSELTPAPWNPRQIKDDRFANLCKSIQADPEFMRLRPVLAMADGTIYAGNMRWRAAKHLGLSEVWAIVEDVPEQLAKERALRDNAGWGENVDDQVGALLAELKEAGSDIDLLGFDSPELDRLLGSVTQLPEEDEADLEPPVEPVTRPGDLWLLGEHRVLCGDSTDSVAVDRLLRDAPAALLVTSPPYGVGKEYETGGFAEWHSLMGDAFALWAPRTTWAAVNLGDVKVGPDQRELHTWGALIDVLDSSGLPLVGTRVWVKQPAWSQGPYWLSSYRAVDDFEYIGIFGAGKHVKRIDEDWTYRGVWEFASVRANKDHSAQFPVELPARCIRLLTDRGDVVAEPFLGAGTTLIAAETLGRCCYGMELSPGYCDVTIARWEKLTGKKAVLDGAAN